MVLPALFQKLMKTLIYFYSHHNQTVECSSEDLRTRDVEDEGIAIGEPNATLNTSDASKFRHLRDKLQQWNSDLKKRRNSQVIFKKKWGNNIAPLTNINTAKRVTQIYISRPPLRIVNCGCLIFIFALKLLNS